ncbi:fumarylacetoacetate hydrolase family protein [Streptomyces sp. NPDC055400]
MGPTRRQRETSPQNGGQAGAFDSASRALESVDAIRMVDLLGSKSTYHATGIGPWITTKDEVAGGGQPDLEMTMRVNGTVTQNDRTSSMHWKVDGVLREADVRSRLAAGDAVFTGTCGFIGVPDGFYEPGDLIEAEIEGLGVLRNRVQATNSYAPAGV